VGNRTPGEEEAEGQGIAVTTSLHGLLPGTVYSYCLVAKNDSGESFGQALSFRTAGEAPPEAPLTEPCGGPIGAGEGHKLCGTLNPHSSARVEYFFEYNSGTSCTGNRTFSAEAEGQKVEVSADLHGLRPNTEYTYCLLAVNASSTSSGQELSFVTEPLTPSIVGEAAKAVTQTDATLEAQLNPNNAQTSYTFRYGTSESLAGSLLTPAGLLAAGYDNQTVIASLGGSLVPATTYYYRLVATNAAGISEGPLQSFITPGMPAALPAQTQPSPAEPPPLEPPQITTLPVAPTPVHVGVPTTRPKPLTQAQKLALALQQCRQKPRRQRASCERSARARFKPRKATPARKAAKR
jgi:hypothetical protein